MSESDIKELLILKYSTLSDRRKHFDSLFWQIPALSLGGQAFLLSIALNDTSKPAARIVSALLGVFIAFVSLASLSRIRLYEFTVTKLLEKTENELFGYSFSDTKSTEWINANNAAAGKKSNPASGLKMKIRVRIMHKFFSTLHPVRSYDVWVLTQFLFIGVGFLIIGSSIWGKNLFAS
jgi:hypothetical protein